MDAHHFYDYGVTGSDLSYSSYPTISSLPNRPSGTSKFDSENSPISPLANYLDSETFTTLSDCQEQHSSTENLSGASSSSNSSLDYNHYFHRPSPSPDCLPEGLLVFSGGNAVLQNAVHTQNMQRALLQLESALMGPDEEVTKSSPSYGRNKAAQTSSQRSRAWTNKAKVLHPIETQPSQVSMFTKSGNGILRHERDKVLDDLPVHGVPSSNLKQLLIACARALAENNLDDFEVLVTKARGAVSITGDPMQRLGAYIVEGLVARKELSGTTIYRSLRCKEPAGNDLLSYMHILYEICPYLKFGYMAANGAIAEACRNENYVHIIDFQIAQGTQWMTLLQALAARPGGAPYVRITGIDDPVSQYARGDGLAAVEKRLSAISEKFNIAVEFNAVPVFAPEVTKAMLDVRPGEAVAVNFPLQLHHTPDESVDVNNPRDELIRMIKSLCPKIVTLVEQESNTNTAPFFPRFLEALDYYHAMFESIDVTLARDRKERINVEQHCLARDIVNVIACEGKERVERHELLGKWKSRFMMAGFRQYPLSSYVNSVIKDLMRRYSEHYMLVEKDGAMLLGWKERNLISASAWY
ncbi:PREDICTED: scarecrow-like protein 21 [Nicotiana attenuata]|uniref:Chitin-inducible gibberellin-responsive protein 1 n=1 Tax=Nicotiana attenuata TaxID=49451 RepID=A0A1J6IAN0_NICAT|nr:PREDICTED: scarecrow-like protein 21 [Nicotiana attenuata]XP_019247213.1 PREDICTED: scarecrow-like protein 21 [Nicotiana attenuata]OIT01990.1 chitin-inducible gibberellin-responsive protein 1 [Nicotiana attenuata]